eukprot:gene4476-biopygen12171
MGTGLKRLICDRIPRELVYWCLRKKNVPEKLDRLVKSTYYNASTVVRTPYGETKEFTIDVSLHQGSALSLFLFVIVMDVISEVWRSGVQWETLFADDLELMADSEEELQEKWDVWHEGMAKKGLKVNIKKTEVMVSSRSKIRVNITVKHSNTALKQVGEFKYLGMMVSEKGGWENGYQSPR